MKIKGHFRASYYPQVPPGTFEAVVVTRGFKMFLFLLKLMLDPLARPVVADLKVVFGTRFAEL